MSRQRFIYPDLFESEKFGALSLGARLLFIGMFVTADDYGRGRATPRALRKAVFPYDDLPANQIEAWLLEVVRIPPRNRSDRPWVTLYEVEGAIYYQLPGWLDKQNPRWKAKSLIPNPQIGKTITIQELEKTTGGSAAEPPADPRHTSGEPPADRRHSLPPPHIDKDLSTPPVVEGRCSGGVVEGSQGEGRGGVIEIVATSNEHATRQGGIDPPITKPKPEGQLPDPDPDAEGRDAGMMRAGTEGLRAALRHAHPGPIPDESKRRVEEADRVRRNDARRRADPAEAAWEAVTLALAEPEPARWVTHAQTAAAVNAIGGWEYLGMLAEPQKAREKFLEAYRSAGKSKDAPASRVAT